VVKRLIAAGLAPAKAYRAATLNAAVRLRREDLGLISAGRIADLLIIDDLSAVSIDRVMASGVFVAEAGEMVVAPTIETTEPDRESVVLSPFSADDFMLPVESESSTVRVRTIIGLTDTSWGEVEAQVEDGRMIVPDDHVLMSVVHRHGRRPAVPTFALIGQRGNWSGAMATTVSHDSHNLIVFGKDAAAMALAANTVIGHSGGYAIVKGTEVTAVVPLPFAGLMTDQGAAQTIESQKRLQAAAKDIGMVGGSLDPIFEFTVASLVAIPGPHLTDIGTVDGTTGEFFGVGPHLL
jgi:adenine deaminase